MVKGKFVNKRIGILGGTFNPIHIGHLAMAQMSREQLRLNKVIFVPSFLPPHKKIADLAAPEHRLNMVQLSIGGNPFFEVSDFEIRKRGKSFTVDTVMHFYRIFPQGTKLFFIIGGDSFPTLDSWKDIRSILKMVSIIVVNRPGYKKGGHKIKHHSVIMPGIDISSSFLRQRVRRGKSTKYFTVESVADYIHRYKLYQS